MKTTRYTSDILQEGFEQTTLPLADDYEGKVVATLVRRKPVQNSNKAVLYIHGFNDYFFQKEMGIRFNKMGYNFYAIDLRKYGRSYLDHQKFNDIRNIKDYYEEIHTALKIIREEENQRVILMGHSTGGLILTLFAKDHTGKAYFNGLILNSPFYEFNKNRAIRILLPLISRIGCFFPYPLIPGGFTDQYGIHLHKSYAGEWNYNLKWKPHVAPKVNLGWLSAIYQGQKEIKEKFTVAEPILVLHSALSVENLKDKHQIRTRDAILNVEHIKRLATHIEGPVEIKEVKGGLHDLFLSEKGVRERLYDELEKWMIRLLPDLPDR